MNFFFRGGGRGGRAYSDFLGVFFVFLREWVVSGASLCSELFVEHLLFSELFVEHHCVVSHSWNIAVQWAVCGAQCEFFFPREWVVCGASLFCELFVEHHCAVSHMWNIAMQWVVYGALLCCELFAAHCDILLYSELFARKTIWNSCWRVSPWNRKVCRIQIQARKNEKNSY